MGPWDHDEQVRLGGLGCSPWPVSAQYWVIENWVLHYEGFWNHKASMWFIPVSPVKGTPQK